MISKYAHNQHNLFWKRLKDNKNLFFLLQVYTVVEADMFSFKFEISNDFLTRENATDKLFNEQSIYELVYVYELR